MTDYERGVEQASSIYKEVIREYVAENAKMRKLLQQWYPHMVKRVSKDALGQWGDLQTLREVGIEVE